MTRPLTRAEVTALAESIAALLGAIERDELLVSTAYRYRLEGSLAALEAVQGRHRNLLEHLRDGA